MFRLPKTVLQGILFCCFFVLFGMSGGEGQHHTGIPVKDLLFQVANLVAYFIILYVTVGKAVKNFVRTRHDRVKQAIEDATLAREREKARKLEIEQKLAHHEKEIRTLKDEIFKEAMQERERILLAARKSAERIISDAKQAVEQETRRARYEIHQFMVNEAMSMAEGIICKKVRDKDRSRLVDESLSAVEDQASAVGH